MGVDLEAIVAVDLVVEAMVDGMVDGVVDGMVDGVDGMVDGVVDGMVQEDLGKADLEGVVKDSLLHIHIGMFDQSKYDRNHCCCCFR